MAENFPGALEFIEFTHKPQKVGSKYQIFKGIKGHTHKYTRKYPMEQSGICG